MLKEQIQTYKNRWKLVADAENREIKTAPSEFLLKQTFSIWEIAKSLDFFRQEQEEIPNTLWSQLQTKWITHHA
ncbi:MAG: hypothetical protein PVI06_01960 [Desulfobacterales bacterium]|jgi:hypothetical protein